MRERHRTVEDSRRIRSQWSVAVVVLYADGENVGKQDRKEKDKGHDGDETT